MTVVMGLNPPDSGGDGGWCQWWSHRQQHVVGRGDSGEMAVID
jgi:hypothetical protein